MSQLVIFHIAHTQNLQTVILGFEKKREMGVLQTSILYV